MRRCWIAAVWVALLCGGALRAVEDPFTGPGGVQARNGVDEAVFARLAELGLRPAPLCSDAVFLRRLYLDVTGTLPGEQEVREFLTDGRPDKRDVWIEKVLAREEWADYLALKWSELLRVKAEYPVNLWPNAAQAYHRWIRDAFRRNVSYDRFVRALLTSSGSNFREPAVNVYRAVPSRDPVGIARAVALTFLGVRWEHCPSNQWAGMAACFAGVAYKPTGEWKEEIVYHDPRSPRIREWWGSEGRVRMPDGAELVLEPGRDPRELFADWLIRAENPWFSACLANRVWSWLMGRGIVHEPDDFRPDNPPSNPALLRYLSSELVSSGYDWKHLFRVILRSHTYQQSCVPAVPGPESAVNFACYPVRRLEAEVLLDALNQVTSSGDSYTSAIPEPWTVLPAGTRAVLIPDGSISSPFLDLLGRSPRDTGLESERNLRSTPAQRLHWLNGSQVLRKIGQSPLVAWGAERGRGPREVAERFYGVVLSRLPTREELEVVERLFARAASRREAAEDLLWALINTAEFVHRH